MGYTTYVTGEFAITPPLTWPEFKDSQFAEHNIDSPTEPDLVLRVDEQVADTDDGQLIRRTAVALAMRPIDEYRAYSLLESVQAAIDSFPGHTFTGRLECAGEETGDLWRVVIRDGRATEVRPVLTWPDENEGASA